MVENTDKALVWLSEKEAGYLFEILPIDERSISVQMSGGRELLDVGCYHGLVGGVVSVC